MIRTNLRQNRRLPGCSGVSCVRCSGHAIQPKGVNSQQAPGRDQISCVASGVCSEGFKLIVIQINRVRTDATNKPDAEFYLWLICFHRTPLP